MSNYRKRHSDYTHISDVLSRIVKDFRKDTPSELARIQAAWEQILDPNIAVYTRPEALKKNTLLVRVASSALTHRLRFMTPEIIEQINLAIGQGRITEIRYTIGNV